MSQARFRPNRPWQIGDRARLWFGEAITPPFTIVEIEDDYAAVDFDGMLIMIYPLRQLQPAGFTRLTWRHLKYSIRYGL